MENFILRSSFYLMYLISSEKQVISIFGNFLFSFTKTGTQTKKGKGLIRMRSLLLSQKAIKLLIDESHVSS